MSRGLWFVAGASAGVYAVVRGRRVAEAFTPDGLADRLNAAAAGARVFADEVAQGRAEKETQLRERLALTPDGAPGARALSSHPAGREQPEPEHDHHHDHDQIPDQQEGTT